ncbi:hypothetical protein KSP35_23370 [Aquihabitans sp. G128]|uniref:hypothetical protein n=1 Tax=Aquihabitans sp. G128 TaxID=2849779 RepID=UPI001C217B39|nr:hypothetical protein [Aquihabitans sp. G128]QXC61214.1 hypothetical protein KSP35_23370 [Aquihabitans sp. G128]
MAGADGSGPAARGAVAASFLVDAEGTLGAFRTAWRGWIGGAWVGVVLLTGVIGWQVGVLAGLGTLVAGWVLIAGATRLAVGRPPVGPRTVTVTCDEQGYRSVDDAGVADAHPWDRYTSAGTARGLWILRRGHRHDWIPRTALAADQARELQGLLGRKGLLRPRGRRRG